MITSGKTSDLNAKFDDIAPRDRRLIELQCWAAIASLRTSESMDVMHDNYRCDLTWKELDSRTVLELWVDAALRP